MQHYSRVPEFTEKQLTQLSKDIQRINLTLKGIEMIGAFTKEGLLKIDQEKLVNIVLAEVQELNKIIEEKDLQIQQRDDKISELSKIIEGIIEEGRK